MTVPPDSVTLFASVLSADTKPIHRSRRLPSLINKAAFHDPH